MVGKYRIVERFVKNSEKKYVIQKKHLLFGHWEDLQLVDGDVSVVNQFSTLDSAKKMLDIYVNSKNKETVVYCAKVCGSVISEIDPRNGMPMFQNPPAVPVLKCQVPPDEENHKSIFVVVRTVADYGDEFVNVPLKYFYSKENAEKYLKEQQEDFAWGRKKFVDTFGSEDSRSSDDLSEDEFDLWEDLYWKYFMSLTKEKIKFCINKIDVEK